MIGTIMPFSILFTPIIVPISIYLFVTNDLPIINKGFLSSFGLILNDFLIKSCAFGTHDDEGRGVIALFGVAALFISTIIFLFFLFKKIRKESFLISILSIVIYGSSIFLYESYFSHLGLIYTERNSESIVISKERKNFLFEYKCNEKLQVVDNDSIWLEEAWVENQMEYNHKNLFKKYVPTGKLQLNVKLKFKCKDWHSLEPRYFLDKDSSNLSGLYRKSDNLEFDIDTIKNTYLVNLIWMNNDTLKFKIEK